MLARPALLALVALPAFAQTIYTWEDKDGVHYTDDPSQVPAKAKPDAVLMNQSQNLQVKVTNGKPAPQADVVIATTPDGKPVDVQPVLQPVATQKSPPLVAPPTRREPDEREWRERFITAHRRIETLEKSYVALERSRPQRVECVAQPLVPVGTVQYGAPTAAPPIVTAPGAQVVTGNGYTTVVGGPNARQYGPAATCAVNAEYDRITREMELTQVQLSDARKDLDQLDRDASHNAIPREWRRGW